MPVRDEVTQQDAELNVRTLRKPNKHPTIFARYAELSVDSSFVLISDHDPRLLHDEFGTDFAGNYDWDYLNQESPDWRIKIAKTASTALPRVLINSAEPGEHHCDGDEWGVLWKVTMREWDLDCNIVPLPPVGGSRVRLSR